MRSFVRSKIPDPIALDQLGRLQASGEPDMLHCPEAYSRYRDLYILPLSLADSTNK